MRPALLVWGRPATIAAAITAARSSGWNVPVFTPPTGADPFVRQQLADHPTWVDGLTFAGGRLTAEVGTGPFQNFEQKLESRVRRRPRRRQDAAGRHGDRSRRRRRCTRTTSSTSWRRRSLQGGLDRSGEGHRGAERGDDRGRERRRARRSTSNNHEGVVDDDIYFARFHDMTYVPVKDDPLSATLPTLPQTR